MVKKAKTEKRPAQTNHRLLQARKDKGLSQREVADFLGLSDTRSIRRWESGVSFPRSYHQRKLAELFGQSLAELGLISSDPISLLPRISPEASTAARVTTRMNTGNLPRWLTSFIGRTEEISEIRSLLASAEVRLVTILGPGGVGKTRFATEIASMNQNDFPDGICLISLAAMSDPALLLPTIANKLQLPEKSKEALIESLATFFESRKFLLILDNFEHILTSGPLIEELLGVCPGLKILVTSRSALHLQAEYEFALDPFPLPAQDTPLDDLLHYYAIELFIQRTRTHMKTFKVTPEKLQVISKICACLDGLPLAIELAATRVKLLGLNTLLQEILQQRLSVLKSGIKMSLARHQTLLDTIEWSYNLLNEQEQWFFRHLALFPGGCSLEAVRRLGQISPFQPLNELDILASLVDQSMLRPNIQKETMPFFSMLETIREYGIIVLRKFDEWETARQIQADYYLTLLAEAEHPLMGAQQASWLTRMDGERENLRYALNWFIEREETEQALSFCEVFGKYCGLRGYWREELHWLETALALSKAKPATKLYSRVLRRAGYILYRFRDLEQALPCFQESVAISEALDDLPNLAGAFNGLAWVHYRQGNSTAAGQFFQRSVEVARKSGDTWSLANALESLGRFTYSQGSLSEAALYAEESIALARTTQDRESLARQLSSLVLIKIGQGIFDEAEALARESCAYAFDLANKPLIGMILACLAETALAQNDFTRAGDFYQRLIQLSSEMDDHSTIARIKLKLGHIALKHKDVEQDSALVQESLAFEKKQGDKSNIARSSRMLENIQQNSSASIEG